MTSWREVIKPYKIDRKGDSRRPTHVSSKGGCYIIPPKDRPVLFHALNSAPPSETCIIARPVYPFIPPILDLDIHAETRESLQEKEDTIEQLRQICSVTARCIHDSLLKESNDNWRKSITDKGCIVAYVTRRDEPYVNNQRRFSWGYHIHFDVPVRFENFKRLYRSLSVTYLEKGLRILDRDLVKVFDIGTPHHAGLYEYRSTKAEARNYFYRLRCAFVYNVNSFSCEKVSSTHILPGEEQKFSVLSVHRFADLTDSVDDDKKEDAPVMTQAESISQTQSTDALSSREQSQATTETGISSDAVSSVASQASSGIKKRRGRPPGSRDRKKRARRSDSLAGTDDESDAHSSAASGTHGRRGRKKSDKASEADQVVQNSRGR